MGAVTRVLGSQACSGPAIPRRGRASRMPSATPTVPSVLRATEAATVATETAKMR